ncbi:ABC transporter ATP-binding protein [Allorhizobium borbori]|uniref:Iron complex transport system ATP-binding protein n=1 Tax=Allorhizobium borbori TaxID=485907 RepID=A0A7W6P3R9_9HYPH|nr:ABC transporter ATP-binding protein [Allorhizobium borbori]MBB4105201.1 iron complex transport system ATP-binding protein [Allorhizobium borbori]
MPLNENEPVPGLCLDKLSLGYGNRMIVESLDLTLPTSAFTVLLGRNGSGKSTVLRACAGLLKPKAGTVLLDGKPLAGFTARESARRIAILPQGPAAPEGLTVSDLVRQGRYPHRGLFSRWSGADEEAVREALELTGMADLREQPLENLSGGQRQRAWIAMSLAQQTEILLLDEPTTFLDLAHQAEVMSLITMLVKSRHKTVVAVLHDINQAARHADHIVMFKAGRLVEQGPPGRIMTREHIRRVFDIDPEIVHDVKTNARFILS